MQPYQHLQAKARNGAVTLSASRHYEQLVVLGASCPASVTRADGLVSSFTVVPQRAQEVIALAVINIEKNTISEAMLLDVSLESGKARVDLLQPFASSAHAIGQFFRKGNNTCMMQVTENGISHSSVAWSPERSEHVTLIDQGPAADDFYDLCKMLVNPRPVASGDMSHN